MYFIKAASKTTGLTVETLRAWERRYAAVVPQRDPNGRRVYGQQELTRLRLLRRATENGHPIRKLANLSEEELISLLEDEGATSRSRQASLLMQRILKAVEQFRSDDCYQTLQLATVMLTPSELVKQVLSPALIEVGERWHSGEFSIAQERVLSGTVRTLLTSVLNTYQKAARGGAIVFATLSSERHELGILLCAYLAASRGIRCHYLGIDLPPEEISRVVKESGAKHVALSLVMKVDGADQERQLQELCKLLVNEAEVWVGGAGIAILDSSALPPNCVIFESQELFEDRLETLISER